MCSQGENLDAWSGDRVAAIHRAYLPPGTSFNPRNAHRPRRRTRSVARSRVAGRNAREKKAYVFRNRGVAIARGIAASRRLNEKASGARRRMVHLRQGGLNHPLSRCHFRGWGADFIVLRTSLYALVRHFFFLSPLIIRPDKGS